MIGTARLPDAPWRDELFASLHPKPIDTAVIRQMPEDFVVAEELGYSPEGTGEHVYLDVTKRDANTAWVARQIADFAGVRSMDVGYAGRKDRHAVTRQWFSVYLPTGEPDWDLLEFEGVELHQAKRHSRKLRPGECRGNHFRLNLIVDEPDHGYIEDRLTKLNQGVPNYFGPQRFGRDQHNLELADRMLRQGMRPEGDKGMLMSAARSWLFNLYLSSRLAEGDIDPGEMGPLYGRSRDPQPGELELAPIYQAWLAGLRQQKMKVGERSLLMVPEGLNWKSTDRGISLEFFLPPGSYATSLVAELFFPEDTAA